MHLRASGRELLVGDTVAELLFAYAAMVGRRRTADTVVVEGVRGDGRTTRVTLLVNAGMELSAESVSTRLPEPGVGATELRLREALDRLRSGPADEIADRPTGTTDRAADGGTPPGT